MKEVERAAERIREFAVPVLLPLFFVGSGLRTDVGALGGGGVWLWAAVVPAVAVVAKWGGVTGAALLAGRSREEAVLLGALMNCRGVTELVVLDIGLGLGVIGVELFTVLVLMALVTTAMTGPAVRALRARSTELRVRGPPRAAGVNAASGDVAAREGGCRGCRRPGVRWWACSVPRKGRRSGRPGA